MRILTRENLGFLLCLAIGGCASMTSESRHQIVYFKSEPPGAKIIYKGEEVAKAPALINIERERSPSVTFAYGSEKKEIPLDTSYRWLDSGLIGLYGGGLAPIFWSVDFLTGAAWNVHDPFTVYFESRVTEPQNLHGLLKVAIAPPSARSQPLSDLVGHSIADSSIVNQNPNYQFLNYQNNLTSFISEGVDFDTVFQPDKIRKVLYETGANHVLTTEVTETKSKLEIKGRIADPNLLPVTKEFTLTQKPPESIFSKPTESSFVNGLIPNSFGVDFSVSNLNIYTETQSYTSSPSKDLRGSDLGFIKNLNTLVITNTWVPRFTPYWNAKVHFAPTLNLTQQHVFFPDFEELAYVDFSYQRIGLGWNMVYGVAWRQLYTYFAYTPFLDWSSLAWDQPGETYMSKRRYSITVQSRFGLRWYASSNLAFELYALTHPMDKTIWTEATSTINPMAPQPTTFSQDTSGYTLIYIF